MKMYDKNMPVCMQSNNVYLALIRVCHLKPIFTYVYLIENL